MSRSSALLAFVSALAKAWVHVDSSFELRGSIRVFPIVSKVVIIRCFAAMAVHVIPVLLRLVRRRVRRWLAVAAGRKGNSLDVRAGVSWAHCVAIQGDKVADGIPCVGKRHGPLETRMYTHWDLAWVAIGRDGKAHVDEHCFVAIVRDGMSVEEVSIRHRRVIDFGADHSGSA